MPFTAREPRDERASHPHVRAALPLGLLGAEYLTLSWLVDLPSAGGALGLASALRVAVPVALGAGGASWLLSRAGSAPAARGAVPLPPWRPLPALALQLVAFLATAAAAHRVLGTGSPGPAAGGLAAVGVLGLAAVILAAATAAPLRVLAGALRRTWLVPLLCLGVGLATWRTTVAVEAAWGLLSGVSLRAVAAVLQLFRADVIVELPTRYLAAGEFAITVAPVCSGADGIGLVVLLQSVWIGLGRSRLRVGRALWLLPAGAIVAFAGNVIRLAALVWVGASGRAELAAGGLHSKLGWLLFIALALLSVAVAERVRWFHLDGAAEGGDEVVPAAAAAYLLPLLAAIGAALGTGLLSGGGLDRLYALRIGAALGALLLLRRSLPPLAPSPAALPALLGLAAGAAWVLLSPAAPPPAEAFSGSAERVAWLAVRALGSCLVIPVVEELAFRGFLLPWLVSPRFDQVPPTAWSWPALALSSLAFGALHGQWALGTLAGLAFAAARLRRGRLGDAIVAHAVANAVVAGAALLGGRLDLWG